MLLYQDNRSTPSTAGELVESIERRVASGSLRPGDRLPPIRELAAEVGLSPNTVASAYRRLCDRGVVVTRGRSGTFVPEPTPSPWPEEIGVPEGLVDLASGSPDPRLLPDLRGHVVVDGPATGYTDPAILPELEVVGRRWIDEQGISVGDIVVTSGALDSVERVLGAHLRPGDRVAIERPGWRAMVDLVRALGMQPVGVDSDDRGLLPGALDRVLDGLDAIVVTPRAQNPTGAAIDAERADDLRTVLERRPDVLVVEDDHAGPVAGAELHQVSGGQHRWAFVQSMAKVLGPDLRLALLTGDDLTTARVSARHEIGPGWVSRILQGAVNSMLRSAEVLDVLDVARREYAARRGALVDALVQRGVSGATGRSGMNVWVPVTSEQAVLSAAASAGFALRAGAPFGGGSPAVRITVSALDTERTETVADVIAGVLSRRGSRLV